MVRKNTNEFVEAVITEARRISAFLVETERGKCGGDVDLAIHRAASRYGFEESSLRSLRYRWRELQDVKASVLERLREAYEAVYERQRQQAIIELEIEQRIADVPTHPVEQEARVEVETMA
jgi:O-acetyl-ADP-ribose deacetylase (regulator of RNase III)